jgi:hypothetical protein
LKRPNHDEIALDCSGHVRAERLTSLPATGRVDRTRCARARCGRLGSRRTPWAHHAGNIKSRRRLSRLGDWPRTRSSGTDPESSGEDFGVVTGPAEVPICAPFTEHSRPSHAKPYRGSGPSARATVRPRCCRRELNCGKCHDCRHRRLRPFDGQSKSCRLRGARTSRHRRFVGDAADTTPRYVHGSLIRREARG